jgi:hypothetical protein
VWNATTMPSAGAKPDLLVRIDETASGRGPPEGVNVGCIVASVGVVGHAFDACRNNLARN